MKIRLGLMEALETLEGYLTDTCEEDYDMVESGEVAIEDSILPAIEVLAQVVRGYKFHFGDRGYELEYEEGKSEPSKITPV